MSTTMDPSSRKLQIELGKIFGKAQQTRACHQKCAGRMFMLYKETPRAIFISHFDKILMKIFSMEPMNNHFNIKLIQFTSKFCIDVAKQAEANGEPQEFLASVINTSLKYAQSNQMQQANHALKLLTQILQEIPNDVQLDVEICDTMQNILLERLNDPRIKLIPLILSALVRLQMPHEGDCPVIAAYIAALQDRNQKVRLEALKAIAPCVKTIPKIKESIRDISDLVRTAAFEKCADIGPKRFTIGDKREILMMGFEEKYAPARKIFIEYLLPNWLTAYGGSFFEFFNGIKYDACEEDFVTTQYICEQILNVFFKSQCIEDLVAKIPLTKEKLVKIEELTTEIAPYWNVLSSILRKSETGEEYVEQILPELTPFCKYIEEFIAVKSKQKMNEFQFLEYQYLLTNLLEIVEQYDFSDEVGRRATYALAISTLQNELLSTSIYKKLVLLASQLKSDVDLFTSEMCEIINKIYSKTQIAPLTESEKLNHEFKMAELRVKLNILREDKSVALEKHDFKRADQLNQEIESCTKLLKELQSQYIQEKCDDPMIICRCLDILIAVLENRAVVKMTSALKTCRDDFFIQLITHRNAEVHWRILRCLSLFMMIDESIVQAYLQIVSVPILTYRIATDPNIHAVVQSIHGITDIFRFYGKSVFGTNADVNNTTTQNGTRRRLYNNNDESEDSDKAASQNSNDTNELITVSYFIGVLMDMLDDESDDIRAAAGRHILYLVTHTQINVSASLFTRIILKWYNPLTEKEDPRLLRQLGQLIEEFCKRKSIKEIIKESVYLTISTLMNAPRDSPLIDVDVDNVVLFFAALINIHERDDGLYVFALDVCMKISENVKDRCVPILIKLLNRLELPDSKSDTSHELISRIEALITEIPTRVPKMMLGHVLQKLKKHLERTETNDQSVNDGSQNITGETTGEPDQPIQNNRNDTSEKLAKPQQLKRRKSRSKAKSPIVLLEQMNLTKISENETNLKLPTITEDLEVMQLDDSNDSRKISDLSSTLKSSQELSKTRNVKVISETSDSDLSNESTNRRRSTRKRRRKY